MVKIIFLDTEHEDFYNEMIENFTIREGGKYPSVLQKTIAYTLGLTKETRMNIDSIFDMGKLQIIPDSLHAVWQTGSTTLITIFAFDLWNGIFCEMKSADNKEEGYHLVEIDPVSFLSNIFSSKYSPYFMEALRIRYPLMTDFASPLRVINPGRMMEDLSYTVYTKDKYGDVLRFENAGDCEEAAEEMAKKLAEEYPSESVYLSFYRASDGQRGFLNPYGGYSLEGIRW